MALSYYYRYSNDNIETVKPVEFNRCTFWEIMDKHCATTPNREAVVFYEKHECKYRATFKQLQDITWNNCARLLEKFPWLQPSDRIAVVGSNRPEVLLAELAGYRIGNPIMFPPTGMKGGEDLAEAMKMTKCKLLFFETSYIETYELAYVFSTISTLKFAIVYGMNAESFVGERIETWSNIFETSTPIPKEIKMTVEQRFKDLKPEAEILAYFTSGTTGKAKAVLWTHFGLVNNQITLGERHQFDYSTRYLQERPLTNFSGSAVTSRLFGINGSTSIVVKHTAVNVSNPSAMYYIIQKERVTHTLLFGYMLHDFVTSPQNMANKLRSLKAISVAGQVLNQEHAAVIRRLLPEVTLLQIYASTEMGVVAISEKDSTYGFIGRPCPSAEVKVIDSGSRTIPRGETGELCCRSPMFEGYITENGVISGKDEYGWYYSRDSCVMNEKGEIKILGRTSDMIRRGGQFVAPAFVENVLAKHPKVILVLFFSLFYSFNLI